MTDGGSMTAGGAPGKLAGSGCEPGACVSAPASRERLLPRPRARATAGPGGGAAAGGRRRGAGGAAGAAAGSAASRERTVADDARRTAMVGDGGASEQ